MKRNRHTEVQIISILKANERGVSIAELACQNGVTEQTLYRLEGQVQRHGGFGGQAPARVESRERPTQEAVGRKRPRQCRAQGDRLGKVVTPQAKRRAVQHLVTGGWLSQRGACRLLGLARSVARYQAIPRDDAPLWARLQALATSYPRYGYLLLHALLCQEGHAMEDPLQSCQTVQLTGLFTTGSVCRVVR
ncbi:transposase [Modicisalibacter xianhensis]|uniref:Transposase n=1 Tax=Modicisalibacter xianhensis TaxID=442341 RepID=A0A4V3GSP5_9GAMM|nr:transposase [Halomonas xianhensis]